ncbi:MAG: C40 family peptidase [Pseudoclavibacter sp.]
MTENANTTAPLTRREARAIERRTGRRVSTGSVAAVSLDLGSAPVATATPTVRDTAEIKRNPEGAFVSVFPTEVIGRIAEPIVDDVPAPALEGSAFVRPVSVRAARPATLVARSRRRTAAGLGVAASAAVLATAAIAVPGGLGGTSPVGAETAGQASLVTAGDDATTAAAGSNTAEAPAPAADLVAAPDEAPSLAEFEVTSFDAGEVEEITETPEPTEDEAAGTGSTGGEQGSDGTGASNSGGSSAGTESTSGGNYDTSSIAGIAQSMMGGGSGWACTDFTAAVYAQAGIQLPGGGVSAQAAGGTQTSNPQVGDLVIFYSGHVGIYAGGGMMWDNPGYPSSYVGWQNVHRSMDSIGSGYYFVTYR